MSKRPKISVAIILSLLVIVPFGVAIFLYEQYFGQRQETYAPLGRSLEEFVGLQSERYTFTSQQGQVLVGYRYFKEGVDARGTVIMAHGLGGGGHNSYLDVADYFASHGYLVFAYDATGNDESEGESVRGIPQGLIDLDYAIRFVKDASDFADLPIVLFGHSWGGYSASSVLNYHPDVRAVIMAAGFNEPADVIAEAGQQMVGDAIGLLLPYLSLYERVKFGDYAKQSSIAGFESTEAGVMIIHSLNDDTISSAASYDVFYEKYKENPRFQFIQFPDRGHNWIWYTEGARAYRTEFNELFAAYVQSLDKEFTPAIRANYLEENLEKNLLYALDEELLASMVSFYDHYTK